MFVGRKRELSLLEKVHESNRSAFIPIYGRRRVGKSQLILHFLKDKPGIYYLGKTASAGLQIREFLETAARVLDEPLLAELSPDNWGQVFAVLTERLKNHSKFILVLDEFQWIAEASPELPSVLQEYWDRHWERSGNIMVILCGSYIGFMEREVLGKKSPLFGRRTAQILLQPFSYREAAEFHPRWSLVNRAMAYFICGGIPLYLRFFNQGQSVENNIEANLLDEFGPLFREPEFLLREELREVDNYFAVLTAIAGGFTTNQTIVRQTGIIERSLPYYLQQLNALGYIGRRFPLTGKRPNPRQVRHVLQDPLLRFWFRFVFPNLSFIQQLGSRRFLRERLKPEVTAYFGLCFEHLCREALPAIYQAEGVYAGYEVGEYWDRQVQIDVVGLRDDNWTDLAECKWGRIPSPKKLAMDLEQKIRLYPNQRGATIARRLFVKKKPSAGARQAPDVIWHGLDDLYCL